MLGAVPRWAGAWVLVALLAGCGSRSSYVDTGRRPVPTPSRPFNEVDVFTATQPTRPFREAGLIESRQASGWSTDSPNEVMRELRDEAAKRGCDGVIVTGSADEVVGGSAVGAGGTVTQSVTTLKGYRAVCIVYTRERKLEPGKRRMADAGISRLWNAKGYWELSMSIASEDAKLELHGAANAVEQVQLSLRLKRPRASSTARAVAAYETCELQLSVDGTTSVATDRSYGSDIVYERVAGMLETAALARAADSSDATLSLCETRIAIAEPTRKRLAAFVTSLRAEGAPKPEPGEQRLEL